MHFDYRLKLDLPLDQAWSTLMDIERIAPCMPGAQIESHDGDNYTGRLKVKLGPMEMTYRGDIQFVERDDAAKRAVVDAAAKEIKGRGAAKTQVTLTGAALPDGSEITISSEFSVSGKAAQFGRGVMEEVAAKLMDDFAERLGQQLELDAPAAGGTANADAAVGSEPPPAVADPTPRRSESTDAEALDIGGAAFGPVLKRVGAVIAFVALAALVYALL